jgi:hypothetical protein
MRPGSLTLLLAPWFEQATGVDADRDMLAEGSSLAEQAGIGNVEWLHLLAEELPRGSGPIPGDQLRAVIPLDGSVPGGSHGTQNA